MLSGEDEVVTGWVPVGGGRALPCRVAVGGAGTWRDVVAEADRMASGVLQHRGFPVGELARELGVAGPLFEVEFDAFGGDGRGDGRGDEGGCRGDAGADGGVVSRFSVLGGGAGGVNGDGVVLGLRYRVDVLDGEAAGRFVGYHLAALGEMAAGVDGGLGSVVSEGEVAFQVEGLAGRRRELPGLRAHELFEERVRAHPDAVAVVEGDRVWTYGELNGRANRLARALRVRGVEGESVVGVVLGRNAHWLASVLAVFKAGGVYLPIEPGFPAGRIAAVLSRAGCRVVLSEAGSTGSLDQALAADGGAGAGTAGAGTGTGGAGTGAGVGGVARVLVEEAYAEGHGSGDLNVPVGAGQLAYIYFTSGSTGEPKGAMCEHAGLVNHLLAKIDDLGIVEGGAVAQVAPQCFDISLWQLLAGLLVGGRTVLVEQDAVLDVSRFMDTVVGAGVDVVQVVPSYLEAVVSALERTPRSLGGVRCVSVTGEALKRDLVERWFAVQPGIPLVNAYGLTETCDDTNHEVITGVVDRVLVGRPVANVRVYVVDEGLRPVPLGAPGEIVFSGVCVGRGYVNDPERTAAVFVPDPLRPGERLYRSGDRGRWDVSGRLEFLGRRDAQVKIRGFRIEIGEVENALLGVAGVRDGAVVPVAGPAGKRLVAFYTAREELGGGVLAAGLGRVLPSYMVPSVFHWRPELPLTANGKVDKKALTALAGTLEATAPAGGGGRQAPATAAEQRLAAAWAAVLGVPPEQIGRNDHFFDRGGTSLSAVKLAIALDRAITLKDVTRHPVLTDLATLLNPNPNTETETETETGTGTGTGTGRQPARNAQDTPDTPDTQDTQDTPGTPGARPAAQGTRRTAAGGLLERLSESADARAGALVCFPYAGGNAVNFHPLARALGGRGPAVYAVELPGHDVAAAREPFAPLEQVVERVVDEITGLGLSRVLLWGHSSGTAPAVETARRLEQRGVGVARVFLAAQLLGEAAERLGSAERLERGSDAEIAAGLSTDLGLTALGELDAQRAEYVGAAYRHDCAAAHRYFAGLLETPPDVKLSAPVTVVVAADDPVTAPPERRLDWRLLADRVDVHELPDGGHWFLRTRPAEAARTVLRATVLPAPS
ncbi:non-ribosomal peptide synthetase [Streptomyces spongiicola]